MAISYVADASWSSSSESTSFTLTKPSGTTSGDYMVAIVAIDTSGDGGGDRTFTPPSGWTSQGHKYSSPYCVIDVMTRTAGGSEPGSWNGSFSGGTTGPSVSIVTTYRGVAGLAIDGVTSKGSGTSFSTSTVNNPSSTNWRVVAAAYVSGSTSYAIDSNEVSERDRQPNTYIEAGMWDSNGTISTGNTSRTVSRGATWESAAAWIGILDNLEGAVASGAMAATLPLLTMTTAANINYSGTMAASLPLLTMTGDGIASPPEGSLAVTIVPVMTVAGAQHAAGTLDVLLVPVVEVVGETRKFGIRVVTPEAESRVTTPRLGAVD